MKRTFVIPSIIIFLFTIAVNFLFYGHSDIEKEILSLNSLQSPSNYGVILDCGSSGSRIFVYQWEYTNKIEIKNLGEKKVSPGLSSVTNVKEHLVELLEFAKAITKDQKSPIMLYATAGMRLLPEQKQNEIMEEACHIASSYFYVQSCETNIRIISGELEGIFGWLSINYLSRKLDQAIPQTALPQTFGFIDIGGASAQIAFQPTLKLSKEHSNDLWNLRIRFVDGSETAIGVFVGTFLGFGANQARKRYLQLVSSADPCLPVGLKVGNVSGTGNFDTCLESVRPLLNKEKTCPEEPCLFNGMHAPIINFNNHHFVGVSEVWYTTFGVYDLGGKYNFKMVYGAAKRYCESTWADIVSKFQHHELEHVDNLQRAQEHCFKSAYLLTVLHNGFSFPKEETSLESMQDVNGVSISWTLGAIFVLASAGIPLSPRTEANLASLTTLQFGVVAVLSCVGFVIWKRKSPHRVTDVSQYHRQFTPTRTYF